MPRKASAKSTKTSKKTPENSSGDVRLLSGGNPKIAKVDGDAPVQEHLRPCRSGRAVSGGEIVFEGAGIQDEAAPVVFPLEAVEQPPPSGAARLRADRLEDCPEQGQVSCHHRKSRRRFQIRSVPEEAEASTADGDGVGAVSGALCCPEDVRLCDCCVVFPREPVDLFDGRHDALLHPTLLEYDVEAVGLKAARCHGGPIAGGVVPAGDGDTVDAQMAECVEHRSTHQHYGDARCVRDPGLRFPGTLRMDERKRDAVLCDDVGSGYSEVLGGFLHGGECLSDAIEAEFGHRPAQSAGRDECTCDARAVGGHAQEIQRGVVPLREGSKEPDLFHGCLYARNTSLPPLVDHSSSAVPGRTMERC